MTTEKQAQANDMIERAIQDALDRLLPNGGGGTITETRLMAALKLLAHQVQTAERHAVLFDLMSAQDVADELGVTKRRVLARAKWLREHGFAPGHQFGREWLFHRSELPNLRGGNAGRPKKQ